MYKHSYFILLSSPTKAFTASSSIIHIPGLTIKLLDIKRGYSIRLPYNLTPNTHFYQIITYSKKSILLAQNILSITQITNSRYLLIKEKYFSVSLFKKASDIMNIKLIVKRGFFKKSTRYLRHKIVYNSISEIGYIVNYIVHNRDIRNIEVCEKALYTRNR